jgi:hypothetical protein
MATRLRGICPSPTLSREPSAGSATAEPEQQVELDFIKIQTCILSNLASPHAQRQIVQAVFVVLPDRREIVENNTHNKLVIQIFRHGNLVAESLPSPGLQNQISC